MRLPLCPASLKRATAGILCGVVLAPPAMADVGLSDCVIQPGPACIPVLSDRLAEIEAAVDHPGDAVDLRVQHLLALRGIGAGAQADRVWTGLLQDPMWADHRDMALLALVQQAPMSLELDGVLVLAAMDDPRLQDAARARLALRLASRGAVDRALALLVRSSPGDAAADPYAVQAVAVALVRAGRSEDAQSVLDALAPSGPRRVALLQAMLRASIAAGHSDAAHAIQAQITDPVWHLVTETWLARMSGQTGAAEDLAEVAHGLALLSDPEDRRVVFDALAQASVAMGRPDIAEAAVPRLGASALDQAAGLRILLVQMVGAGWPRDDWAPIAETASVRLSSAEVCAEDGCAAAWSQLARAIAAAGDPTRAARMMQRIDDPDDRARRFEALVNGLLDAGHVPEAAVLLPDLDVARARLWATLRLGQLAQSAGHRALFDDARAAARALMSQPDASAFGDYPRRLMAELDALAGAVDAASDWVSHIDDPVLGIEARLALLSAVAVHGAPAAYRARLSEVTAALAALERPDIRRTLFARLAAHLVAIGRPEDILGVALGRPDAVERDLLLIAAATALRAEGRFGRAVLAVAAISAPDLQSVQEHAFYVDVLWATKGQRDE